MCILFSAANVYTVEPIHCCNWKPHMLYANEAIWPLNSHHANNSNWSACRMLRLQTNLSFICVCFLFCFLAKLEFCSSGSVTARRARGYVSNNNSHFAAVCSDGVRVRASAHKQQLNYVPNFQVQVHGCSQDRDQRLLPAIGYRLNEPRISNLFPFEH